MEWFVMQRFLVERYHLYRHRRFKHLRVFAVLYNFSCVQSEVVLRHRMHRLALQVSQLIRFKSFDMYAYMYKQSTHYTSFAVRILTVILRLCCTSSESCLFGDNPGLLPGRSETCAQLLGDATQSFQCYTSYIQEECCETCEMYRQNINIPSTS